MKAAKTFGLEDRQRKRVLALKVHARVFASLM